MTPDSEDFSPVIFSSSVASLTIGPADNFQTVALTARLSHNQDNLTCIGTRTFCAKAIRAVGAHAVLQALRCKRGHVTTESQKQPDAPKPI